MVAQNFAFSTFFHFDKKNDSKKKIHTIKFHTFGLAADLMYQSRILASYMSGSSSYINHFIAGYCIARTNQVNSLLCENWYLDMCVLCL